MILDEEAPAGICDERGWTLDLFASADEAPGRAAGEASAALAAQQEPDTAPVGRPLFTGAADEGYDGSSGKGETRALLDVAGQAVLTWRSGDLKLRRVYDALRRPRALYVDEGSGERLVQLTVYGDAVSDADAGDFALGKPLQVYDTAGRLTLAYDFRGRTVEQARQVFEDITNEADWDTIDGLDTLADIEAEPVIGDLSAETFTVATTYGALLDRLTEQTAPDTSRTVPGYDAGGRLVTVQVYVHGAVTATDFVTSITYNARGQRESITYANNTGTTYEYNEDRFWLDRVLTNRSSGSSHGAAKLQDLNYTRDAVGNITEIVDAAHETVFFSNTQVSPTRSFTYDDLYRLVEATGREKVSQTQTTAWYSAYAGGTGVIPDSGSPALRSYTQSYEYDEAGNILEMAHVPSSGSSWTRSYQVATANNQLEATTIPGDGAAYDDEYVYNDRGAMVYMPHLKPGENPNITRDFRDQIRKVNLDSSDNLAWYAYDAGGQRVRKLIVKATSTEERIYIGGYEVWRERDLSDVLQEERQTLHVLDDQRRIAMVETLTVTGGVELDDTTTPLLESRLRYQLDDHLGTALLEVDEDGGVITYEEFHPYGTTAWYAERSGIEVSSKRYRYTGMERDEETGLQYHSARYYAPWLGRWDRADPTGLSDTLNRFSYARCAPIGGSDRIGLFTDVERGARAEHNYRPSTSNEDGSNATSTIGQLGLSAAATVPFPWVAIPAEVAGFTIDAKEAATDVSEAWDSPTGLNILAAGVSAGGLLLDLAPGGVADAPAEIAQGLVRVEKKQILKGGKEATKREAKELAEEEAKGLAEKEAIAASRGGGTLLYHGTDVASARAFLGGERLDAAKAAAGKIDGPPGFFLATHVDDAAYFATRRSPGTVL